jgi:hypothetical protein
MASRGCHEFEPADRADLLEKAGPDQAVVADRGNLAAVAHVSRACATSTMRFTLDQRLVERGTREGDAVNAFAETRAVARRLPRVRYLMPEFART